MKRLRLALVLTLLHVVMTGSVDGWTWVIGGALSLLIAVADGHPHGRNWTVRQLRSLPRFLIGTAGEIARSGWDMTLILLRRRPVRPGLVKVPMGERTLRGAQIQSLIVSAAPGSVVLEIDDEQATLCVQSVHGQDEERVREELDSFYEDVQREVEP